MTRSAPLIALMLSSLALAGCVDEQQPDPVQAIDGPDVSNLNPPAEKMRSKWPECSLTSGTISWPEVPGAPKPAEPVEATIKTDAYGVSHIYADDAYSLFYANGYVQARDRLLQMDILRQVGYGESAQYLGQGQLGLDFQIHREMYTRDEIQAQYDAAPAEGKEILQAFSDGVNRFMGEAAARDQWPAEFSALGRAPPPWQPVDSVALINYLIGFFGVDGGNELNNLRTLAQLESTLGEKKAWDAFGDWVTLRAEDTYTSIHPDDLTLNGCEDASKRQDVNEQTYWLDAAAGAQTFGGIGDPRVGIGALSGPEPRSDIMSGFKWGSNALVVDGSLTSTGVPMMWGAPQMGYYKPPVPYQIGLHGGGFDAVGIGVAGAPGIVIGRNNDLAWTATSGIEDQVDLVALGLTGDRSYQWDNESRQMDCWTVEHQVMPSAGGHQGAPEVYEQEVCRAEGWPVVAINEAEGVAWMAKTTTRGEELMGAMKWLMAARATSISEFQEMMSDYPFTFNYFIASREEVAQIHTGDVPLRAAGYDPRLPTPSGAAYEWTGEAYTEQMGTFVVNPSRGYIANWNNAPVHGWRAGDQAGLWGPVQRVQQIEFWMQDRIESTGGQLTIEDLQWVNWQAATHDSHALPFMPYLIAAAAADPQLAGIEAALRQWFADAVPWRDDNFDGRYDDPAHAIWDFMIQDMFTRITGDELGTLTKRVNLDPPLASNNGDHGTLNNQLGPVLAALQGSTAHDWCDDRTTNGKESCQQQLTAGLLAAKRSLTSKYGANLDDWLEPVHTDKFLAFGAFSGDIRPMVNRGSWVQMVSMAESGKSVSVLPPGNSGLITSAELAAVTAGIAQEPSRLTAELDLYWNNEFKPFPLTVKEVDAVSVTSETLVIL